MTAEPKLDTNDLFMLSLNIGNLYFDIKEIDSAALYYTRVKELFPVAKIKLQTQLAAYAALSEFAKSQNRDSLAFQYRENHENVLFTMMQQRQEQTVYRIQQQYDYESLQNKMNKKIIQRHITILIISILLLVTTIIILVLQNRHKQLLKSEEEMKQQLDGLCTRFHRMVHLLWCSR